MGQKINPYSKTLRRAQWRLFVRDHSHSHRVYLLHGIVTSDDLYPLEMLIPCDFPVQYYLLLISGTFCQFDPVNKSKWLEA